MDLAREKAQKGSKRSQEGQLFAETGPLLRAEQAVACTRTLGLGVRETEAQPRLCLPRHVLV